MQRPINLPYTVLDRDETMYTSEKIMNELTVATRKITKPTICDKNNSWIS
jgi:hypothetical protein